MNKKKLTPGVVGLMLIIGAVAANGLQPPPDNQSEMMGRGIATAVLAGIGVVLIIVHFIRKKKGM